jgi:hypothetical protein
MNHRAGGSRKQRKSLLPPVRKGHRWTPCITQEEENRNFFLPFFLPLPTPNLSFLSGIIHSEGFHVKIPQMHAVCSEQAHPLLPSLNSHSPPSHVFYWNSLYSPQASNAPCFFLHLLSAEIIGVHYHARHP